MSGYPYDLKSEVVELIGRMKKEEEIIWHNPHKKAASLALDHISLKESDVMEAQRRWARFAPYLQEVFPQTQKSFGLIESPIKELTGIPAVDERVLWRQEQGTLFLKMDQELPISGSIKARGGIYEVLYLAEMIAKKHGELSSEDDFRILREERFRELFSRYEIMVGSTGNLGLSIGIMGRTLGFGVTVHMSHEASAWKKRLLRQQGVSVIEHVGDYGGAVAQGRNQANQRENTYFVDDEQSKILFLGYSVAAWRLDEQLKEKGILIGKDNPLYVYLPCGVGGGPGGITFGLKLLYGDHVHCFMAEPTQAPCMLLGLMTEYYERIAVQDIGLTGKTLADGLAVSRPSALVSRMMSELIDGCYTVRDETLRLLLRAFYKQEGIFLEPAAVAGMLGPSFVSYQKGIHVIWATGGGLVPENMKEALLKNTK